LSSLVDRANASEALRASAVGWQGGVGWVLQADASKQRDLFVRLAVSGGRWHAIMIGHRPELVEGATFVVGMPWSQALRWVRGGADPQIDPIKALVQGSVTFQGDLPGPIKLGSWLTAVCQLLAVQGPHGWSGPVSPGPGPVRPVRLRPDGGMPPTRFVDSGGARIAFSVFGRGPSDVVLVPGLFSHVERGWAEPSLARFLTNLSGFTRTVLFDKRGMGLSDRDSRRCSATLQERVDDLTAVVDAAGCSRPALIGFSEGGLPHPDVCGCPPGPGQRGDPDQ
jgi:hypothetical protein